MNIVKQLKDVIKELLKGWLKLVYQMEVFMLN
jgi:hypothetical protein